MRVELTGLDETRLFAEDVALALKPGDCLCLSGDLGAGKSTFARALIRAVADDPELEVPSPTFTLVQSYRFRLPIAHLDLYRIGSPEEVDELGLDDALSEGAALIEWPERALEALPEDRITFGFEGLGDSRAVTVTAPSGFAARLARSRAARQFLADAGYGSAARRHLQGDASARSYETIRSEGREPVILMNSPRQPDGPPIRDGLPYSQIAHLAEDVVPFIAIDHWLRAQGLSAPEIFAADAAQGFLLIENLGSEGVVDADGHPVPERYGLAIDCLADLHGKSLPPVLAVGESRHRVPAYDPCAMQIEVELLTDWYLPHRRGAAVPDAERAAYFTIWQDLFARLQGAEQALVLRDYHSPNLIWRGDREGLDRLGIIDFQDAMIGPSAYDVASLCQDARVTVPEALADQLLARYIAARRAADPGFDADSFREAYAIMAAQRAAKILGIFVRLNKRDGKPGYMRHLPRIEAYIAASLAHPVLQPLRFWFTQAGIGEPES
ncbi:tRNA threonylcarbamoyladenosine biosynthesis protein TsaE [Hoeflea olei]|uniref:tRNA threonylcarbamoyladenosine biosynthesis protein TsaE n=1 Tax=Hoeflea olei TaxID=1480615 RepID=A0A1C1YRD3_9HYPH|nr:tRNA threonylcarbamoyladenosine biosynthesis protein TsaE [Hoeflea olei]